MKKIVTLLLCIICTLGLMACGSSKEDEQSFKGTLEIRTDDGTVIVDTSNLVSVEKQNDTKKEQYFVLFKFDEDGATKLKDATTEYMFEVLSVYVNGKEVARPSVHTVIEGGECQINFDSPLDTYSIVNGIKNGASGDDEVTEVSEKETETEKKQTTAVPKSTEKKTETTQATEKRETKTEPTESTQAQEVPHRDGMYGISDKSIYDIDGTFSCNKVRNDVTGKWRVSTIAADVDIEYYALDYYNKKIYGNGQIHGIVNFTRNTTTCIQSFGGNEIYVTIYDYVQGEEHDADLLFSGMELASYIIYTDNGDIEKISE